ncbi:MAG: hypothetical protein V1859_07630 [archaeon]
MKQFHFSKTYFNNSCFEYTDTGIRITIKEIPSIDIDEEEYSLRIETRHVEAGEMHRNYAIEHHLGQEKHKTPHLQFKFHTEEIGSFRIFINIKNNNEYESAILGFIYKIKRMLEKLEKIQQGITSDILVLDLVNKLEPHEQFLNMKLSEAFNINKVEFDSSKSREKIEKISKNELLIEFLGNNNIEKMANNNSN